MLAPVFPNRTSPHLMRGQFGLAVIYSIMQLNAKSRRIAFATSVIWRGFRGSAKGATAERKSGRGPGVGSAATNGGA